MRLLQQYIGHLTMTGLFAILLIGSWMAGQSSRTGGQTEILLIATFALLIPVAIGLLYLQSKEEAEE